MILAVVSTVSLTGLAYSFLGSPAGTVDAPRVVAMTPASGAVVRAGTIRIAVTFDRPMRRDSYSFVKTGTAPYPDCDRQPTVSADGRTFMLACHVVAHQRYSVGINGGRFRNFAAADTGQPAIPALLSFSVGS